MRTSGRSWRAPPAGAGAGRPGGGGGVPGARRRADTGSESAGRSGRGRGAGQVPAGAPERRCGCSRWRERDRWTSSSRRGRSCCRRRSRSPRRAAATLLRCCSRRRSGWSRWIATLARETYLEAFAAALSADRLAHGGDAREVAAAVLAADWEPSTRACDLLLDGLALSPCEGYAGRGAGVEGGAARVPERRSPRRRSCAGSGWPVRSREPCAMTQPGTS